MINAGSWFSVIRRYRSPWETQTTLKYPSQKRNTWCTQLGNSVTESSHPRQRKADAASVKSSGLTVLKLPGFYRHHYASLGEEKFSNPMHIAACGREPFHGFSLCMVTENLQSRTLTLVVLSARLLIYTQKEEHYYNFLTQGHRLFLSSNNFRLSAVDASVKSSKSKILYLVLYFMFHEPRMG